MKKSINRKGLVAGGLALLLAASATFAYFTDRANYSEDITGAKFGIEVTADTTDQILMPTHDKTFNYTVKSTGTVDADVRERVLVYNSSLEYDDETQTSTIAHLPVTAANPEFGLYDAEDSSNDLYATKQIGDEAIMYTNERELKAGADYTQNGVIRLNASADNNYADRDYFVAIVVEAKQKGASDWTTIATETLNVCANDKYGANSTFAGDVSHLLKVCAKAPVADATDGE